PRIDGLKLVGGGPVESGGKAPQLSLRLSEPAGVSITVQRRSASGDWRQVGVVGTSLPEGRSTIKLRLGDLKPGTYRRKGAPRDDAGNKPPPQPLRFEAAKPAHGGHGHH